jgi:hypothetical protein
LIYVQTAWHKDEQRLDENIKCEPQDLWRKSEPKKITPLGSVSRGADRALQPCSSVIRVALTVEGGAVI